MSVEKAYNSWSEQYDSNENKTRDLEAKVLREILSDIPFENCLEIGCGTGKNTVWLAERAKHITAVDLSEEMLNKAKEKIKSDSVSFIKADLKGEWSFTDRKFDLIIFSLVLEHISNLDYVFEQAAKHLQAIGHIYIGELHPFKQYSGSKARFETEQGLQVVECYTHHISDFTGAAAKYGLKIEVINEYFDEENKTGLPRIIAILFNR